MCLKSPENPSNKVIISLHGLLGSKYNLKSIFRDQEVLCRRTVYLPQLRNGFSADYHDSHKTIHQVEDLIRFMDEQGIEKATFVGYSSGGHVALTLAGLYPERVDGYFDIDQVPNNFIPEEHKKRLTDKFECLVYAEENQLSVEQTEAKYR